MERVLVFRALVTDRNASGEIVSSVRSVEDAELPAGNVLVAVEWAGFNYKDGLAITGRAPEAERPSITEPR